MDALEAILTRRSIRSYTDQPVTDEVVDGLMRAAMAAPSAGNQQPWQFVLVRDRTLLSEIATISPYGGMLSSAQLAVAVCGDLSLERIGGFWVQDCSAATENLLVAANAMGLGAVWLGVYPVEERAAGVRTRLGLPEHVVPLGIVSIGYPAENPGPADRYDRGRIHLERW
jgi:nitroreductase